MARPTNTRIVTADTVFVNAPPAIELAEFSDTSPEIHNAFYFIGLRKGLRFTSKA
jgi:hypothetical protein